MNGAGNFTIVFMGSPEFAVPSLTALFEAGFTIGAVVSGPDKRRGRGNETSPTPVKSAAIALGLPVIDADDLKSASFETQLRAIQADLFVVVAFRVLPRSVLAIPRIGSVNLHGSLLPQYRGAAPIHRAVINGDTHTGATIFMLDEQVDTGHHIAQVSLPIHENDTTGDVYHRMMHAGANLLVQTVTHIQNGTYTLTPQDNSQATSAPKLFPDDALLDFCKSSTTVHNHIRGLSPHPTAYTTLGGKRLRIFSSVNVPTMPLAPGSISVQGEQVFAGCSQGSVQLLEVQLEGKKRIAASAFFRGFNGSMQLG